MTKRLSLAILVAASACAAFLFSCAGPDLVIGFGGSLSGRDFALGVEGRNAAILFVDMVNAEGGIGGRKLRLVIEDHASDPERVVPADKRLLDAGALVIFGHFTSAFAEKAIPFANREGIALVSPTATAAGLGGKADSFFRTVMSSERDPAAIAEHMKTRGLSSALVIHTLDNKSYTDTYVPALRKLLNVVGTADFADLDSIDYGVIAALPPRDAIIVVASAIDTATIAQSLAKRGLLAPLYVSGWAGNDDLVLNGGIAVEGAVFVHQVDLPATLSTPFTAAYRAAFGTEPGFGAVEAWDALLLIKAAIEAGGTDRASFLAAVAKVGAIEGLCGRIAIDANGDASRDLFYRSVRDGRILTDGRYR